MIIWTEGGIENKLFDKKGFQFKINKKHHELKRFGELNSKEYIIKFEIPIKCLVLNANI